VISSTIQALRSRNELIICSNRKSYDIISLQSTRLTEECESVIYLSAEDIFNPAVDMILLNKPFNNIWVPYNTLFLTSIIPSVLFFAGAALLTVVVSTNYVVSIASRKFAVQLARAPLTFATILLGSLLDAIGLI
jgi:hypothetical protein